MTNSGMNQDVPYYRVSINDYLYAKNMMINEKYSIEQDVGNRFSCDIKSELDPEANVIILGRILISAKYEILACKVYPEINPSGWSILFVINYDDCTCKEVLTSGDYILVLNFNENYPISGDYHFNNKNECVLFLTDNYNTPKVINIGDINNPFVNNNFYELVQSVNMSELNVSVDKGGALLTGNYTIVYIPQYRDGSIFSGVVFSNPVNIVDDDNTSSWQDGSVTGIVADKSILVNMSNTESNYKLGIIYQGNNTIRCFITDDKESRINSIDNYVEVTLEELLIQPVNIETVKSIVAYENKLHIANFKESSEDFETLQGIANNITLSYTTEIPTNSPNNYTFQHSEVYAFYIRFIKSTGHYSSAYHIPGRTIIPSDEIIVSFSGNNYPKWKVGDTCTNSELGYFHNENELYPTSGNFPVGNVRHHKIPSIAYMKSNFYSGDDNYGVEYLDVIQVIANNVVIPSGYVGAEILYAKRNYNNSSVIGTDLLLYSASPNDADSSSPDLAFPDSIWSSGGNWGYQGKPTQASVPTTVMYPNYDFIRLHNFELLRNQPNIVNYAVKTELKIKRNIPLTIPTSYPYRVYYDNTDVDEGLNILQIFDSPVDPTELIVEEYYSLLSNSRYMGNGSLLNELAFEYNNIHCEPCLISKIDFGAIGGLTDLIFPNLQVIPEDDMTGDPNNRINFFPEYLTTYLMTIFKISEDVYFRFNQQSLVYAGSNYNNNVLSITCKGDSYSYKSSFITTATRSIGSEFTSGSSLKGVKNIFTLVYEGRLNIRCRYESDDLYTKYYPKTVTNVFDATRLIFENLKLRDMTLDQNIILLESEYNTINDYRQSFIWDGLSEFIFTFPNRIRISDFVTEKANGWRIFRANAYYDMPTESQSVTNLFRLGDKLGIHTELHLYLTRPVSTQKATDVGDIVLGSNNTFSIKPQNILPESEYAGLLSKHEAVVTSVGYFFINARYGKVYLLNAQLNELSYGLSNFLRDNLPFYKTEVFEENILVPVKIVNFENKIHIPIKYFDNDLIPEIKSYFINSSSYDVLDILQDDFGYTLVLDRVPEFENDSLIEIKSFRRKQSLVFKDNNYIGLGYALGFDFKNNRLMLTKINNSVDSDFEFVNQIRGIFQNTCEMFPFYQNGDYVILANLPNYYKFFNTGLVSEENINQSSLCRITN